MAAVTVVIPCYRDADTIARAVESAFAQTWSPAEVVVIDDFSDDAPTSLALDRLSEEALAGLKVIRLPTNVGPSGARNAGWDAATQEFVAFLDADDIWAPEKLERQLPLMQDESIVAMSGHGMETWHGEKGPHVTGSSFVRVERLTFTQLLFRNRLPTSSVILRREIPYRFNPERRYCEDYELWLRIALKHGPCGFVDEPLAFSFKAPYGEAGLSSALRKMESNQTSVYAALFRERAIRWPVFATLLVWAKVRYIRRLAFTLFRKVSRR